MKLRRLHLRLAVLFGLVAALLAIGPLLLWRSERVAAIEADFTATLIEQMEIVQRHWVADEDVDVDFPAWQVNAAEDWINPLSDSDVEPPLLTWAREVDEGPEYRTFSTDGEEFRAYVSPYLPEEVLVTLVGTESLRTEIADANKRTILFVIGLSAVSLALGWLGARLAVGPTRRMVDGQQGFLADAAHEMRTPLAVIMASSSQALSRERSSEEYVRSLSEIRSAAERASTGVNELLDLVRFDSGQAIPRLAPLRLDLLAEEVAASVRADDGTVVADPSAPVVVNADMPLMRQALDNLVRNAIRRADRVELTSRVEQRFGVVEVSDNGPGFDPDGIDAVFDRYERGDRRGETGIGLAIVKAIVDAHGGVVSAANSDAGGAVVTIKVPLSTD